MNFLTNITTFLMCLFVGRVSTQDGGLTVVGGVSSIIVSYGAVDGAIKYHIYVTHRHEGTAPEPTTTSGLRQTVQGLEDFTLYRVTVTAIKNEDEEQVGSTVEVRTLPRATLRLGTPFTDSVDVFLNMKYSTAVTQWVLQYRKISDVEPETKSVDDMYSYRVTGLSPKTEYEIRARPSMLYGTTAIQFDEELYSEWIPFTTDSRSVFGSVVLPNEAFTQNHRNPLSDEWARVLEIVTEGYAPLSNYNVTIIRIENNGENRCRVHYRLKEDINAPNEDEAPDFFLAGDNFAESFINNGDKALATTYALRNGNTWTLIYVSQTACPKIVERYLVVNLEDGDTAFDVHLNVASSDSTTPEEDDGLTVASNGELITDDDIPKANVTLNTVVVLTPKFLVKDCLIGQDSTPLYSEYFEATLASSSPMEHFTRAATITGTSSELLDVDAIRPTFSSERTSVTLSIPAVPKAIKYEVINGTTEDDAVLATLEEIDIDNSEVLKITVDSLAADRNYTFTLRVTTKGLRDDISQVFRTNPFPVVEPPRRSTVMPCYHFAHRIYQRVLFPFLCCVRTGCHYIFDVTFKVVLMW